MIGERAQHRGKLVDVGAAAAEFARHAGFDQAGILQQCEIIRHELVLVAPRLGAAGELWAQFAGDIGGAAHCRFGHLHREIGAHSDLPVKELRGLPCHVDDRVVAGSIPVQEMDRRKRVAIATAGYCDPAMTAEA